MFRAWLRRRTRPRPAQRVAPQAEWLEPRLLYSADAGALLAATTGDAPPAEIRTLSADFEFAALDASNTAPVLAGAESPLTVYEDFDWTGNVPPGNPPPWSGAAQRAGVLVADIIDGHVTDAAGSLAGIAIVGTSGAGTWQYTLDGSNWVAVPAVADAGALLLAADGQTRLRFLPSTDWNSSMGTAGITFRAWDQTAGTAGTLADASVNGGTSAFSEQTATSTITVVARNDAPVANGATGGTVEEGAAPVALLASGGYAPGPATASDEAAQALSFRFTTLPAGVQLLLADGVTPVNTATSYTLAQFQGMLFRSAAGAGPGTYTVGFEVRDDGGAGNGGSDRSSHSLVLTVTNVDVPTSANDDSASGQEDAAASGNVLANDIDVDSPLAVGSFTVDGTVYAAGATANLAGVGSFTLAADGSFGFTPVADWNGAVPAVAYTTTTGATATLRIVVTPVDDGTLVADDAASVDEDSVATGNVLANDSDVDDVLSVASFTIAGTTYAAGSIATIAGMGSFTLDVAGNYAFTPVHDWSGTLTPVRYTTNTGSDGTLAIVLRPVDDATAAEADRATVPEDTPAQGNVLANDIDPDTVLAVATFTLGGTTYAAGATVALAGTGSFTLAADGSYSFSPEANWNGALPQVTYTTLTGATSTLDITVQPGNDAPSLAGANPLPALLEDADGGAGLSVADLLAGQASDVDGGPAGIAVTAAASTGGRWQFSLDGGGTWQEFGSVSDAGAQLLDATARLRFVPAPDWNGVASGLVFRAWDASGGGTDTRAFGGDSAFSAQSATASVTVQAVNDAPVLLAPPASMGPITGAGSAVPLGLDGLGYGTGGGADEAGQALTFTLSSLPPAGLGTLVLADGSTAADAGRAYTLAELQGLRFVAAPGTSGTFTLAWTARDDGGTANGGQDQRAGSLAFTVDTMPPAPAPPPVPPVVPAPEPAPAPPPPPSVPPAAPPAPTPAPAPAASAPEPAPPAPATAPVAAEAPRAVAAPVPVPAPAPAAIPPQDPRARTIVTGDALVALAGGAVSQALLADPAPLLQQHVFAGDFSVATGGAALLERRALQPAGVQPLGMEFEVTGFAGVERQGLRMTVEDARQALRSGVFLEHLDQLRRQLREEFDLDRTVSISVAGLSLGASLVYILWLVRGGVLVGSYLSALPAWRLLDPLPVLARVGDEEPDDEDALPPPAGASPDPLRGFS